MLFILGNVRLTYADSDGNGSINPSSEIISEKNYYPFGLEHKGYNTDISSNVNSVAQNFGYNGKENNPELGLDWMDFGARNYDPALGRWMNIDPLAEQMRRHSPYNYAFNNPVFFIDPDGMAPDTVVILGDNADKATEQLNASSSLEITRDEKTGELSASGEATTEADKGLLSAINDQDINVTLKTTNGFKTEENKDFIGGAFKGSTVGEDGVVNATQEVNVDVLEKIDNFTERGEGVGILHEALEGYEGAKNDPGASAGVNGSDGQDAYDRAHNAAANLDPRYKNNSGEGTRGTSIYTVGPNKQRRYSVFGYTRNSDGASIPLGKVLQKPKRKKRN